MNLDPIVDRLESQVSALKLVGSAANFANAALKLAVFPAAFVLPATESAERNPFMDQAVEQTVSMQFGVAFAVRDLKTSDGSAAHDALEPVRSPVRDALLGWKPPDAEAGIEFVGGQLIEFENGVMWWVDTYRTEYMIRSV